MAAETLLGIFVVSTLAQCHNVMTLIYCCMYTFLWYFAVFIMADNFCGFMLAPLSKETIQKWDLLLKARICSYWIISSTFKDTLKTKTKWKCPVCFLWKCVCSPWNQRWYGDVSTWRAQQTCLIPFCWPYCLCDLPNLCNPRAVSMYIPRGKATSDRMSGWWGRRQYRGCEFHVRN